MGGHYEGDGYEIRSCELALYYYRKARRRGLGTASQGGMVTPTLAPPHIPRCQWCAGMVSDFDQLCQRCAADQDRAREVV